MREAFDDALVTGWEEREPGIRRPDEDDRQVVASAVQGGAQGMITADVKDFPGAALKPLGLEAVHPDDFLLDQLDLSPPLSCRSSASKPPTAGGRRSPRETWPPSWAGREFRTSPTRSSTSWPPPSTAPDTGMGAAASEHYESCAARDGHRDVAEPVRPHPVRRTIRPDRAEVGPHAEALRVRDRDRQSRSLPAVRYDPGTGGLVTMPGREAADTAARTDRVSVLPREPRPLLTPLDE
jgi:hypothetical protein